MVCLAPRISSRKLLDIASGHAPSGSVSATLVRSRPRMRVLTHSRIQQRVLNVLSPYGKWLKDTYPERTISLGGIAKSSVELYDALTASIDSVYDAVLSGTSVDDLYRNPFRVPDGPCYAFLIHGHGPAVDGFSDKFNDRDDAKTSSNVVIANNSIGNIKCMTKEVPAVVIDNQVQNDVRGAVFQIIDTITGNGIAATKRGNGTYQYRSNVVADMQLFVARAIHEGIFDRAGTPEALQTNVNTISPRLVDWATSAVGMVPTSRKLYLRCNGDSMHHVGKGTTVIRVDDTTGFSISNNRIYNVENLSLEPFGECSDLHDKASSENAGSRPMGNVRAISVSSFRPSSGNRAENRIDGNRVVDIRTFLPQHYLVIGIDVQGDGKGKLLIEGNRLDLSSCPGTNAAAVRVRENVEERSVVVRENTIKGGGSVIFEAEGDHLPLQADSGGCPFAQGGNGRRL